jgi:hypothetical protein
MKNQSQSKEQAPNRLYCVRFRVDKIQKDLFSLAPAKNSDSIQDQDGMTAIKTLPQHHCNLCSCLASAIGWVFDSNDFYPKKKCGRFSEESALHN